MTIKITLKPPCPTLERLNKKIVEKAQAEPQRGYLGMSQIGHWCERSLWYYFRMVDDKKFTPKLAKACERGHLSEEVYVKRFKVDENLTLQEVDPETGKQWRFKDLNGHFMGHSDGKILGIVQAPKTWHIWEHKEKQAKFFDKLVKLREDDEKSALQKWDENYYAQAQCYMHYSGLKRHFLTCSKEGFTEETSVRTNYNAADALKYIAKSERIINSANVPERPLAARSDFYKCREEWCDYHEVCWKNKMPKRTCRSCLHSTPVDGGEWKCEKFDRIIDHEHQIQHHECHRFVPSLVSIKQVDVDGDNIVYQHENGDKWIDEGK